MWSDKSPNEQFKLYLFCSYLYYKEDLSPMPDEHFDALCSSLAKCFDQVNHRHKDLVTKQDLEAGTGYAIQYPTIVMGAARAWYRDMMGIKRYN